MLVKERYLDFKDTPENWKLFELLLFQPLIFFVPCLLIFRNRKRIGDELDEGGGIATGGALISSWWGTETWIVPSILGVSDEDSKEEPENIGNTVLYVLRYKILLHTEYLIKEIKAYYFN